MIIENGVGDATKARVDGNNQVHVFAVTEDEQNSAAEKGQLYNINTGLIALTGTSDSAVLYFKNNESPINGESNIIFRFAFISDQSINEEGVVIDDFQIDASSILSVNDFEDGEFLIYPNPSSDIFNIRRVRGNNEEMNVKVYDIMGKLIRQDKNITDANYKLNMAGISKGIYFLQVNIENKFLVKKLVMN